MRCEVCGREIYGKTFKARIEGADLTVCGKCVKYGTIIPEEPQSAIPKKKSSRRLPRKPRSKRPQQATVESDLELAEDFDVKIMQARRKSGLTHEDLGRKINEKVSVLKKIETKKMTPDYMLATRLEHALKIKLLVPASQKKVSQTIISKAFRRERTLGDLVRLAEEKRKETS